LGKLDNSWFPKSGIPRRIAVAFGPFLMPILQEIGIAPSSQDIMEVTNLEQ